MVGQGLGESELGVALCGGVLLGIGGVHAVNAGALQQGVAAEFEGAQCGSGVGGKEGVAGAAGDERHPAALEHGDGVVAVVVARVRLHGSGRKHLGLKALAPDGAAQRQRVDDGGQHAHAVAGHAVETLAYALQAAENVASAVDDGNLVALAHGGHDLAGKTVQTLGVEALSAGPAKAFS